MEVIKVKIRKYDWPDPMPDVKTTYGGRSFEEWADLGVPEETIRNEYGINHPEDMIDVELVPYTSTLLFKKEDFDYIEEDPKNIFNIYLRNGKKFELYSKKEIIKICGDI